MSGNEHILAQVRDFADRAHGEQLHKYTPERYIVHPLRVMRHCQQVTSDIAILCAALLHDVLEDTATAEAEVLGFLVPLLGAPQAERTLKLAIELTDVYVWSAYPRMRRRERKEKEARRMAQVSAEGQTIKYADILDNSGEIVTQDPEFAPVYLKECRALLKAMTRGNAGLREQALDLVDTGLKILG